jgi:hypothetical protein
MVEENPQIKGEEKEQKEEKRIEIEAYGENRIPVLLIDHEEYNFAFAKLYYVYEEKTGKAWEEDYIITANERTIPSEEALRFYIFDMKKPFKLIVRENEECSKSGAHCLRGNYNNGSIYTVKALYRYPAYMLIYDIEDRISEPDYDAYVSWPYYGKLLLLKNAETEVYRTKIVLHGIEYTDFVDFVDFEIKQKHDDGFIRNMPLNDIVTFQKKKYILEQRMPVIKTKNMLIIFNTMVLPLRFKIEGRGEFSIPPRKAYLKIMPK